MAERRIDSLICSGEDAKTKADVVKTGVQAEAEKAKEAINTSFDAIAKALEERKQSLLAEVVQMAENKVKALDAQLVAIDTGSAAPMAKQDSTAENTSEKTFLLCVDEVVLFKSKLEELQKHISSFGEVLESSTYAAHSLARGPAVDEAMKRDVKSFLWIYANDLNKVQRTEGGEAVSVQFSSPEDFETTTEDLGDGRYKISVVPKAEGTFSLRIGLGEADEEIFGSPFEVQVMPPPNYSKIGVDRLGPASKPWVNEPMCHPTGLCFDRTGRYVVVADQSNDRLQIFDASATSTTPVLSFGRKGQKAGEFDTPGYIAIDREDRVFVTDILNHRVQVLSFNSKSKSLLPITTFGAKGKGFGEFQFPRGVAFTDNGQLLVCDHGNGRVQMFDINNNFKFLRCLEAPEPLAPLDVVLNRDGEILVADQTNRIHVFDTDGIYSRTFGKKGTKDGMFNYPMAISVDDMNMLFVCDQGNRRMQILSASDGSFKHKWGGWKRSAEGAEGEEDGGEEGASPAPSPEPADPDAGDEWVGLHRPAGVTVNSQGVILVSDW
eukprot:CAMPEP_0206451524 /NCGR_PEP_ID=MMETSP0324_2-20121206/19396_1 /ASSEMBLY_ACC=CAM_ASM_000836 /TAXON_ID=2866 /ORGANISM="Crypthecodinium cohnii, Strain Seligo" /LENGTH=549 /DNA_ID=CAMNT_0053921429 /DNA_START=113 /DNA_END=1759 /DNA_ORIENTATION=-